MQQSFFFVLKKTKPFDYFIKTNIPTSRCLGVLDRDHLRVPGSQIGAQEPANHQGAP
jgi:hypothetical protein